MNFDDAVRVIEILMGLAFAQQSLEHIKTNIMDRAIFLPRFALALLLVTGYQSLYVLGLLLIIALFKLHRYQGPYNGGADRMGLLVLLCLFLLHIAPTRYWQEMALGYLALQLVLSYFISGWVKIKNPDWRSGRALRDVFQFSAYPVSVSLRGWAQSPRVLFSMSWAIMIFELFFPLTLLSTQSLMLALIVAASFHFANACLFGLNRFFWIWLSAYPSLLWFQFRLSFIV